MKLIQKNEPLEIYRSKVTSLNFVSYSPSFSSAINIIFCISENRSTSSCVRNEYRVVVVVVGGIL